jgi:hypothetical protein
MSRFGFGASLRRDRIYPKRFHRNVDASWLSMTEPIQPPIGSLKRQILWTRIVCRVLKNPYTLLGAVNFVSPQYSVHRRYSTIGNLVEE